MKVIALARKMVEMSADDVEMAVTFYRELSGRRSKRGRPRKAGAETPVSTPKKRGRPRKVQPAEEAE